MFVILDSLNVRSLERLERVDRTKKEGAGERGRGRGGDGSNSLAFRQGNFSALKISFKRMFIFLLAILIFLYEPTFSWCFPKPTILFKI